MQEVRECVHDTAAAANWLRVNGAAVQCTNSQSHEKTGSLQDTTQLMEDCKKLLALVDCDLRSSAQQKV